MTKLWVCSTIVASVVFGCGDSASDRIGSDSGPPPPVDGSRLDSRVPPPDGGTGCVSGAESTAAACTDGCDNDGDSRTDCADPDCSGVGGCPADGGTTCPPGAESTAAYCGDGCDNDGDGMTDCADPGCAGVGSCPATCPGGAESTAAYCGDSCDNDGDGDVDCADPDCLGVGACPECTAGELRCDSGQLQTCDGSGSWPASGTVCLNGCNSMGGAHCAECTSGSMQCSPSGDVQQCGADGRWTTTETCARGCDSGACLGPRTVTIINDLTDVVAGPNDWGQLNQIIRVRFGPTQSSVETTMAGERLVVPPTDFIAPGGGRRTFSTEGEGTDYYLFIQNGWWEYLCTVGCSWTKHVSAVVCCDCASTCYKYNTIRITSHAGGDLVIRASDFLPAGNWCSSPFC